MSVFILITTFIYHQKELGLIYMMFMSANKSECYLKQKAYTNLLIANKQGKSSTYLFLYMGICECEQ